MFKPLAAGAALFTLAACASVNSQVAAPLLTDLSKISNTAQADLQNVQAVALAATPPDQDGANCAGAALTVQAQIAKVLAANNTANAGALTVAELASLFQPGSPQSSEAENTLATGCVAKANDVMGAAQVVAMGGVAGVLAATNTVLPLGAAIP